MGTETEGGILDIYRGGITGGMRTTPTVALEVLLGLTPLHLQLEAKAKAEIYRLDYNDQWKLRSEGFGHAHITRNMERELMVPRYVYDKSFTARFPDRREWKDSLRTDRKGELIWYTEALELGSGYGTRWDVSLSLGQYTTVSQAEVDYTKKCVAENLDRNFIPLGSILLRMYYKYITQVY
jgi:hypothetical protein